MQNQSELGIEIQTISSDQRDLSLFSPCRYFNFVVREEPTGDKNPVTDTCFEK